MALPDEGSITDVAGIEVGHHTDARRPTGCSVIIARAGAVAGVDVRGAAPGTRETDLLDPTHLVEKVHAVMLSGGSAWGLDAASGAMHWLEEHGIGLNVGVGLVPLVPAAVLFDLHVGDGRIRPDAAAGYAACAAASRRPPTEGNVGAGAGATVGKLFGPEFSMKSGIGSAAVRVAGVTVGALIACNAVGDIIDPHTSRPLAGARSAGGRTLRNSSAALLAGEQPHPLIAGSNTTIGVIATDARLTKAQARRLAVSSHDGLARAISPVHTMTDGDTLFTLATGMVDAFPGMVVLATMAAEAVALATLRAALTARAISTSNGLALPAARDLVQS